MATTFDTREQAYERRFVLEEEARFHARNQRNRLLATWACARMCLSGPEADGYVASFTESAVVIDDETLIARLQSDLRAAGIEATVARLRAEMSRCAALAQAGGSDGIALDQGSSALAAQDRPQPPHTEVTP